MEDLTKILQFAGEDTLESPHSSKKTQEKINLYKLVIPYPKDSWAGYKLPEKYDKIISEAIFAIPQKAINTINYLLMESQVQMYNPLNGGYDTCIRESLMEIGQMMINKAFMLASDYYYDSDKKYFSREPNKLRRSVLLSLIIYKFWCGRTGRGLQSAYAGLSDKKYDFSKDDLKSYYYIYETIKHFERHQEKEIIKKIHGDAIKISTESDDSIGKYVKPKKEYKLFSVNVGYSEFQNKEQPHMSCAGGTGYKISAITQEDAETIALNKFSAEAKNYNPLEYVSVKSKEIEKPKILELHEEGIIDF